MSFVPFKLVEALNGNIVMSANDLNIISISSQKLNIDKTLAPVSENNICLGEFNKPFDTTYTKFIRSVSDVVFENSLQTIDYTPIVSVNNSTNSSSTMQWIMNNQNGKTGMCIKQNGSHNITSEGGVNTCIIRNLNGDLHIGNNISNSVSFFNTSLPNTVCIGFKNTLYSESYLLSTYKLAVNGLAWSTGWRTISDSKLKDNVLKIDNACDKVSKLSGYTYNLKSHPEKRIAGIMAQEVKEVLPEAVDGNDDGSYSLDYNAIISLLVEAVKELYFDKINT